MKKLPFVWIKGSWKTREELSPEIYDIKNSRGLNWILPKEIQDWINDADIQIWVDYGSSSNLRLIFSCDEEKAAFLLRWFDTEHLK